VLLYQLRQLGDVGRNAPGLVAGPGIACPAFTAPLPTTPDFDRDEMRRCSIVHGFLTTTLWSDCILLAIEDSAQATSATLDALVYSKCCRSARGDLYRRYSEQPRNRHTDPGHRHRREKEFEQVEQMPSKASVREASARILDLMDHRTGSAHGRLEQPERRRG